MEKVLPETVKNNEKKAPKPTKQKKPVIRPLEPEKQPSVKTGNII